jgi:hypothetical protein
MCCREDEVTELAGYRDKREHVRSLPVRIFDLVHLVSLYSSLIQEYSQRQLTDPNDELNAFTALSKIDPQNSRCPCIMVS